MSVPSSKSTVMSASAYLVVERRIFLFGRPKQFQLDRNGDPLLDLLRGEARRLHDDFHLDRRDVGEGVDRQARQDNEAGADQQQHAQGDEQALRQRKSDQALEHQLPAPSLQQDAAQRGNAADRDLVLVGDLAGDHHMVLVLGEQRHGHQPEAALDGDKDRRGLAAPDQRAVGNFPGTFTGGRKLIRAAAVCPGRSSPLFGSSARTSTVWVAASVVSDTSTTWPGVA